MADVTKNAVTGDRAAQSYGWLKRLTAPVANGATVVIPTPDFDFEYTDINHAQVGVGGLPPRKDGDGVTVAWKNPPPTPVLGQEATITNNTGAEWPSGSDVYLFCPHLLSTADNKFDIKHQLYSMQKDIEDLTARVAALEGARK